jgi:hypothetical protein
MLGQLRADHVAHRDALLAALDEALGATSPRPTAAPPAAGSLTRAELRVAEQAASAQAAAHAAQLAGRDAALLASIAACEAGHAELLS